MKGQLMSNQEVELSPLAQKVLGYTGLDRDFISAHGLHRAVLEGVQGVALQVRLTSYRALPLSCIEGMSLRIDGTDVDMSTVTFILSHYPHKLADLPKLSNRWWFILELATIFIPLPLEAGAHVTEGTLITVEPYVTAGRFSFYNSSKRTLVLDEGTNVEVLS